jgi:polysaccharide pyruvyl transferase WcaK-like protein
MGPFGYGNLGDAATQDAIIARLRRTYPGAEIFGFSLNPADTEARHGIKTFPISWRSWKDGAGDEAPSGAYEQLAAWLRSQDNVPLRQFGRLLLRAPKELGLVRDAVSALHGIDLLVISGGGQLEDYWGAGPWSYPYTLLKWTVLARLRGVRIVFVSVGAGPIQRNLSKRFLRTALSLADYRSYRDEFSRNLIESIGMKTDDPVYPDLAFGLSIDECRPAERPPGVERVVAIGPIGYFKKGFWPEHDDAVYEAYLQKMSSFIAWLLEKNRAIVFVPGEVHWDQEAIGEVIERLRGVDRTRVLRPSITTVPELLSQLAMSDIVVGSRFHGLLLGQALGKPVIGLSYQEKIDALMEEAGQSRYCMPVGSFGLEQLKDLYSSIERDYESVRAATARWAAERRAKLDEQYGRVFS